VDDRDALARIDAALIDQIRRDGDTRAFGTLVRRHQGRIRAQLRQLLRDDPASADDLAQETFVLAWRKLEQFRGEARFATWLHRIAHACFLQHRRSRAGAPRPADPDADYTESAALGTSSPELGLDLDTALGRLPDAQRTALLYCAQLGLSHEEAATVLDLPLGTVKTHVTRGKAKLRELLRDWGPHPDGHRPHD